MSTGATRFAALDEAIGPKASVTGARSAAGSSQLVFVIALTPPNRANMASE